MNRDKILITRDNGEEVSASAPIIVSASRSTDIPALYADWFFNRLERGYSAWKNPFNGVKSFVSYKHTRLIVFWSKNPNPLIRHLDTLKSKNINSYIQFTLNDYEKEGLEMGVPQLQSRIDTFKRLVDKLGYGKVIWRFDPMIQTDKIKKDDLLSKAGYIADQLKGYTEKMVFSFADIQDYRKVKNNLAKNNIAYNEFSIEEMNYIAKELSRLNANWGFDLATCGEEINLEKYKIKHNKCVDDDLMIRYFSDDEVLMQHLGVQITKGDLFDSEPKIIKTKSNKDKGQRKYCGCIISKDIGEYNTCPHLCEYCYANTSKEIALRNYKRIQSDLLTSETITGE